jgi:DNA repair protein RecO (recombination protein O)
MNARRRQQLEPAFILHHRPYRDTSRILDVFTASAGRLTLFARGARGPKSKLASVLMPFRPLLVAWSGRGEAAQLVAAESAGEVSEIAAPALMSAFYVNELLIKLTTRHDPQPQLFADYTDALDGLREAGAIERTLRIFEKRLLAVLGYGIEFDVETDRHYLYRVGAGWTPVGAETPGAYDGASIRSLAAESLATRQELDDAKRLLRAALDRCLDGRDLTTRAVARSIALKTESRR